VPNKWFVGVLAFLLPPLSFLYISEKRWAVCYLLLLLLVGLSDFYLDKLLGVSGLGFVLSIVAIIHSISLLKYIDEDRKIRVFNKWWGALSIPFVFFATVFLGRSFIIEPFQMPSGSMAPTLNIGNHILVYKSGYGVYGTMGVHLYTNESPSKKPESGEIFAFYPPHNQSIFVKRIIGVPGDKIELSGSTLTINGNVVSHNITKSPEMFSESLGNEQYQVQYIESPMKDRSYSIVVPDKSYFVMGDNRNNSSDSRHWGMVPKGKFIGKVIAIW
jgi:signal peptidase I